MASALYANPVQSLAGLQAERIDQGVDYAGSGPLRAIARGIIQEVSPLGGSSGWPGGGYVRLKITQPGPLQGQEIYYAENISPTVKAGQLVNAGDVVAIQHPGSPNDEIGFESGNINQTYASAHGGYTEGESTAAGNLMDKILRGLGAPAGRPQPQRPGSAPNLAAGAIGHSGTFSTPPGVSGNPTTPFNVAKSGADALGQILDFVNSIKDFVNNPAHGLLTVAFLLLGVGLVYSGLGRAFGIEQPIRKTAKRLPIPIPA